MYFQCSLFIWAPEKYCEVFFYQARSIVFEGGGGGKHIQKILTIKFFFIYLILILIFYIVPKRGGQTPCCDKKQGVPHEPPTPMLRACLFFLCKKFQQSLQELHRCEYDCIIHQVIFALCVGFGGGGFALHFLLHLQSASYCHKFTQTCF